MYIRVLCVFMVGATMALAQRGGGGMGGGDTGGPGGMGGGAMGDMGTGMRSQRTTRLDAIADKLKLNKEQKQEASKIFDAAQEEAGPINEQLQNGRKAITQAILSGASADDVNKAMQQFTAIIAQETAVEAKAFAKLYASLEAKQQSKAAPVFADLMAGMFEGRNWRTMGGGGR